jgi:hypothetical protein
MDEKFRQSGGTGKQAFTSTKNICYNCNTFLSEDEELRLTATTPREASMRIHDFPRPKNDTARGIHWSASVYHPTGSALDFWIAELQGMKMSWVKVLDDGGGSSLDLCQRLLAVDMMPIVRLYRPEPNPGTIGAREQETIRRLVAAGVRYFETNNEPDLPGEWQGSKMPEDWLNVVVDNFIKDADKVIALGGLPAFPAMGVGNRFNPFTPIVEKGRDDLFEKGAWVAIHNYTINHPLDYPYDAVNQEGTPVDSSTYERLGSWAWDSVPMNQINEWRMSDKNPGDRLEDDPSCFLSFHLLDQMATQALGHPIPIISTEGGPIVGSREDRRYPRLTPALHAEMTLAITEFMHGARDIQGIIRPDSYFAACHWLIANYRLGFMNPGWEGQSWYTDWWNGQFNLKGELPVVAVLKTAAVVDVHPGESAVIAGKVVRMDTGEGLPDLAVRLLKGNTGLRSATTGADGNFRFDKLGVGVYDIAIAPWGVVRRSVIAAIEPATQTIVRLSGGQASTLSGLVQTSQGAPAGGVRVSLVFEDRPVAEATTGKDGVFRFERLPAGSYRISIPGITIAGIGLDGWQTKNLKLTLAASSGLRYTIAKRLLTAQETGDRRLFYGTVTDAAGRPLNGIKLEMRWEGAVGGTRFPTTITGTDTSKPSGYYEFLHTPGMFSVAVVQGDFPADSATGLDTAHVTGREGQPICYEINFRLQPLTGGPGQVDGSIAGGQAGRKVVLTGTGPATTRETTLGADGSFFFKSLPAGNYHLSLQGVGTIAGDVVLQPGALWKVLFPMKTRLSGKVMGHTTGMVAILYAPAPWTWTRQASLASDGTFALEGLPSGRYRLVVGEQTIPDIILNGESNVQLSPVDLTMGRRSIVRGRVASPSGTPQKDISVILKRDRVVAAQLKTASDGLFRFANLAAGTYTLEALGLGQIGGAILLDGEREQVINILWPAVSPQGIIQGRVLSAANEIQANVRVRLLLDGADIAQQQTDTRGAYRFTALSAGTYSLAVGSATTLVTGLRLEDGATLTRDIKLPADDAKVFNHYLLMPTPPPSGRATAGLILRLVVHHLDGRALAGFSADEAVRARRVTLLGDALSQETEDRLKAAGCAVTRVKGDAYAVATALEQMFAEG